MLFSKLNAKPKTLIILVGCVESVFGGVFWWREVRGHMKQFYIIMSTMGTFKAMDFVYTGELSHSCAGGIEGGKKIVKVLFEVLTESSCRKCALADK